MVRPYGSEWVLPVSRGNPLGGPVRERKSRWPVHLDIFDDDPLS